MIVTIRRESTLKIKIELELDTDNPKDEIMLEELVALLENRKYEDEE